MRCRTREELLEEAVRLLVESGPFAMAFIAWHDPDTSELVPGARFGDATGYCDRGRFFADERDEGRGPGGIAFRTNAVCVSSDFMNDVRTAHWHDAAAVAGWRSSAAVPVRIGGVPRGVLNVYSRVSGFFGPLQLDLLHEVMTAVSLGLERLESEDQRRQAEAALAASEQRLKRALDAGGIGLWDYDLESGMIVWDGHSERIFGLEAGRFGGTYADFLRQVHPADVEKLNRAAAEHAAAGTPYTLEFRVIWPDGSIHWVESHGEYSFSDSGRPVTLRGAALDITARKEAEQALRQSESNLHSLLEHLPMIVSRFDREHRHLYINSAVQSQVPFPRERFIGRTNVEMGMPTERVRLWDEAIEAAFVSGEPQRIRFNAADYGVERSLETIFVPERDESGQIRTVLSVNIEVETPAR